MTWLMTLDWRLTHEQGIDSDELSNCGQQNQIAPKGMRLRLIGMFSTRWILYSHNFMERKSTPVGFLKDVKLSGPLWQVLRAWEHGGSTNRASDSTFVRSLRLCIHHILSWFPAFPVVSFSLILYSGCLYCSLPNLLDWRRALDPNIVLVSLKWEKRKKVLDSANGHKVVVQ
jgi:hypothetical protein